MSSAGFWPGGGGPVDYEAFYSYAYPAPQDFAHTPVRPVQAFFSQELGEFILSYDAVRTARDPERTLMEFLQNDVRRRSRSRPMGSCRVGMSIRGARTTAIYR